MAIGAALGGLFGGLAEGLQTGAAIAQRQEQIDLQRSEQKLKIASAFTSLKKMPLDMRKIVAPGLLAQFEKAYGMEVPQVMKDMAVKGDDETWGKVMDQAASFMTTGKGDIEQLKAGLKALGDPEQALQFMDKINTAARQRESLEEQKRHARAIEGLQGAQIAEQRATRMENRAATAHRDIIDNAGKTLTGPGQVDFEKQLSSDPTYAKAAQAGNTQAMYAIANKLRQGMPPELYAPKGQNDLAVIQELRGRYEGLAKTETDPVKQKKYQELADRYNRLERFGGKEIPQAHLDFLESSSTATTWISKTASILADPQKAGVLSPRDRAELAQAVQGLKLELATLNKRGANFTDSEQKMIEATMGGNPNDIISRGLRNRADFIDRLRTIHGVIESKIQSRERALIGGKATITPFPEVKSGTTKSGLKFREE